MGTIYHTGKIKICQNHTCTLQDRTALVAGVHGEALPTGLCPTCTRCIEDEDHAIFHCRTYTQQRPEYEDLFENSQNLRSFLVSNPPHRVAHFLNDCHDVRLFGQRDVDLASLLGLDHDDHDTYESDSS